MSKPAMARWNAACAALTGSLVEQWQTLAVRSSSCAEPLTHSMSSRRPATSVKDPLWIARRDQLSRKTGGRQPAS